MVKEKKRKKRKVEKGSKGWRVKWCLHACIVVDKLGVGIDFWSMSLLHVG